MFYVLCSWSHFPISDSSSISGSLSLDCPLDLCSLPEAVSALLFFSPPHLNLRKLSFQSHFLHLKFILWPLHQLWSPRTSCSELLKLTVTATICTPAAARISLLLFLHFISLNPFLCDSIQTISTSMTGALKIRYHILMFGHSKIPSI